MCIIIDNSKGLIIDPRIMRHSATINDHGYGRLDLVTGQVIKTMNKDEAQVLAAQPGPAIHHFRWASVGEKSQNNLHPFPVRDGWVLFMNGTVSGLNVTAKGTDTEAIARIMSEVHEDNYEKVLSMFNAKFLIANAERGRIIRTGSWVEHDGSVYSKDNVLPDELLAVYGTLRKGYGNHRLLRGSRCVGHGTTLNKHRMVASGIPFVIEGGNDLTEGMNIEVEVYQVPASLLRGDIDTLEGHPINYERRKTDVLMRDGKTLSAWLYFSTEDRDRNGCGPYYSDYKDAVPMPKHPKSKVVGYHTSRTYRTDYAKGLLGSNPRPSMFDEVEAFDQSERDQISKWRSELQTENHARRLKMFAETNKAGCFQCGDGMITHGEWQYCETCGHFENIKHRLM